MRTLLIASVACLAVGVWLICWFTHGAAGFTVGYPFDATKLHLDLTTTGAPALAGTVLTVVGSILLVIVWLIALVRPLGRREVVKVQEDVVRRERPFDE